MKTKILFIFSLLIICGCENITSKTESKNYNASQDIKNIEKNISENSSNITKSSENIEERAKEIREEANEAEIKISEENKKEIKPHIDKIKENSNEIIEESTNIQHYSDKILSSKDLLNDANNKIKLMEGDINQIQKERDKALKERDKAIEAKNSQLKKMLQYLIVGSLALTGLFAALFFFTGSKIGMIGAVGCGIVMATAMFVEAFMTYIIIGGAIIFIVLIALLIYNIYKQKKAFFEVVDTVEIAQEHLDPSTRNKIFGGTGETGIMDTIQSSSTIQMVKDAKKKMSKLWYYSKTHK